MKTFVASPSLRQADHPLGHHRLWPSQATAHDRPSARRATKTSGSLAAASSFSSCLRWEVDTVEVSIVPILLGGGIPLLPPPARTAKLKLSSHKAYRTGLVSLTYEVQRQSTANPDPSPGHSGTHCWSSPEPRCTRIVPPAASFSSSVNS